MSDDDFISRETKYTDFEGEERMDTLHRVAVQIAMYTPEQRIAYLRELDRMIEGEDVASTNISEMKERASLLSLKRSIEGSHRLLRRAGR